MCIIILKRLLTIDQGTCVKNFRLIGFKGHLLYHSKTVQYEVKLYTVNLMTFIKVKVNTN